MRTAGRIMLALLLVLAGLCAYLLWHIDWIERDVDTGFSETAEQQPYLAAALFLQNAGRDVELRRGFALLSTLFAADSPVQSGDTLVLLDAFNALDIQQAANVLQFVDAGGTVFYAAQNRLQGTSLGGEDYLLGFLQTRLETGPDLELPQRAPDASASLRQAAAAYVEGIDEIQCEVSYGLSQFDAGAGRRGRMNFPGNSALVTQSATPYMFYADARGAQILMIARGAGKFVLTTDGHVWDNNHLACYDHAYFLLQHQSGGTTWFLENRNAQSLPARLWALSPLACVLALCALLLLLQRGSRRFGPLLDSLALARRSFLEHLEAGAQLLWDRRQGSELIEFLRRDIDNRMQQIDRRFTALDTERQRELIAHTTRLPLDTIALAMG